MKTLSSIKIVLFLNISDYYSFLKEFNDSIFHKILFNDCKQELNLVFNYLYKNCLLYKNLTLSKSEVRCFDDLLYLINKEFLIVTSDNESIERFSKIKNENLCGVLTYSSFKRSYAYNLTQEIETQSRAACGILEEKSPKIGVLLRQWDSESITSTCIKSLLEQNYSNFEIYLLDDNSSDWSPLNLFINYDEVTVIPINSRAEYCLGFNIAANYAISDKCEYLFIVNNDTKNFSSNLLDELQKSLTYSHVGIASPKVLNFDGIEIHWRPRKWLGIPFDIATEGYMVTSTLWVELDGFNNSFFRYCEDLELVKRIKLLNKDQKLLVNASFEHQGNGTTWKLVFIPVFYYMRNMIWIQRFYNYEKLKFEHIKNALKKMKDLNKRKLKISSNVYFIAYLKIWTYTVIALIFGVITKPRRNNVNDISDHLKKIGNSLIYRLK